MGRRQYRSQAECSALIKQQAQSGLSGARLFKRRCLVAKCFYCKRWQVIHGKAAGSGGRVFCSGVVRVVDINTE